jgi:NAD(P)-dependent dehydrogenase (short-subunit alcohol dehydrogenase family)
MTINFEGLNVVVTGGTGALGSALVDLLLQAGARCYIPAVSPEEVERFAHGDHPSVSLAKGVDLTREDSVESYYGRIPDLWASIHCAGGFAAKPFGESRLTHMHEQMSLNFVTCFLCCREAVRGIRSRNDGRGGRIVNVAARPALEPRAGGGMTAYTASKAAVAALTQSLGEELAAEGIWVNAVAPSVMDTDANRRAMPGADFDRWPKVSDVAATMAFLASPQNRSTRGSIVTVYGAA